MDELQAQTGLLKDVDPQKEEEIMQKKARVEERSVVCGFLSRLCVQCANCHSGKWWQKKQKYY